MKIYMLDTNVISHIMRGDSPAIRARVAAIPHQALFVSVICEAELQFGLLKTRNSAKLAEMVERFLSAVTVLPWHRNAAYAYAQLKCRIQHDGINLSPFDLLIAAHAKAADAILVSRDQSFAFLGGDPRVEDWAD